MGMRLNTVKRGRDIMADVQSLGMASVGIYGSLADQAWQGLEAAGMYLGYAGNRNAPHYPSTYLSGRTTMFNERGAAGATSVTTYNPDGTITTGAPVIDMTPIPRSQQQSESQVAERAI